MSVLIKICGLKSFEALDVALEAGADLVGFVFFSPSPRHVGADTARALYERERGRSHKVALSVDASDDELAASIDALTPDLLQLHGRETPERVAAVRARFGLPVMKALPIAEHADLAAIRDKWPGCRILSKPADPGAIVAAVVDLFRQAVPSGAPLGVK